MKTKETGQESQHASASHSRARRGLAGGRWRWLSLFVLLALAAGYALGRPHLERLVGRPLPTIGELASSERPSAQINPERQPHGDPDSPVDRQNAGKDTSPPQDMGSGSWVSPAGLIYVMGPQGEHRVDHILRHLTDSPERNIHSVFSGDRHDVFRWIDDAYRWAERDDPRVVQDQQSGARRLITVDMRREIGYEGGQRGAQRGFPRLRHLRLILEDQKVVTAYPFDYEEP